MKSHQGNKATLLRPLISSPLLTSIILMSAILAITACLILPLFGVGLNRMFNEPFARTTSEIL